MKYIKFGYFVLYGILVEYGIIKMKYHGMPKKRYFKFDPSAFNKLYADFELNSNNGDEDAEEKIVCASASKSAGGGYFSGLSF